MFVLGFLYLGLQSPSKDCKVQGRTAKSNGVRHGLKSPCRIAKNGQTKTSLSRSSNAKLKDRTADCQMQWLHAQAPNMEQDRQNLFIDTLLRDVPSNSFCRCCTFEVEDSSGCALAVCHKGLFAAAYIWHCCQLFCFILLVSEPWPADPSSLPGMLQGRQPSRAL